MKLNIFNLFDVEAQTTEEVEKLVQIGKDALGACAEFVPSGNGNGASKPIYQQRVQPNARANIEKYCAVSGNKRFMMNSEEKEQFGRGPEALEQAARARLLAMGETEAETISEGAQASSGESFDIDLDDPLCSSEE